LKVPEEHKEWERPISLWFNSEKEMNDFLEEKMRTFSIGFFDSLIGPDGKAHLLISELFDNDQVAENFIRTRWSK